MINNTSGFIPVGLRGQRATDQVNFLDVIYHDVGRGVVQTTTEVLVVLREGSSSLEEWLLRQGHEPIATESQEAFRTAPPLAVFVGIDVVMNMVEMGEEEEGVIKTFPITIPGSGRLAVGSVTELVGLRRQLANRFVEQSHRVRAQGRVGRTLDLVSLALVFNPKSIEAEGILYMCTEEPLLKQGIARDFSVRYWNDLSAEAIKKAKLLLEAVGKES